MSDSSRRRSGFSTVLFDLDGTLIDSVRLILDSYHHTLASHGLEARHDDFWLAGFSFGAWVALLGARQLPVKQVISIAPPVGMRDFTGVLPPPCPWLVIQGEADEVVEPGPVFEWLAKQDPAPTVVRMPETGHFFHRRLLDLRGAIKNGVRRNLPPLRA